MKSTLLLLFSFAITGNSNAQPGALDQSFGNNGQLTTTMSAGNSSANAVLVQSDSKILAAGYASNNGNNDFALARYNADGTLDNTFNHTGKAFVDFNGTFNHCSAIAQQANKKIVLAGYTDNGNGFDLALARLNESGSIDTDFGNSGKVTVPIGLTFFGNAVAIQSDQKILVAGYAFSFALTNEFVVMRFLSDGTIDTTFGNSGLVMTTIGSGPSIATALIIQPNDGKIILAGHAFNEAVMRWEAAVIRFNTDGSPDAAFGAAATVITPIPNADITINAVALQEDGKIIIAGYNGTSPSNNNFTLLRYLPDGTRDNSFADQGILISAVGAFNNQAKSVIVQDHKIFAGGSLRQGTGDRFVLACYNENGTPDIHFGNQGVSATTIARNEGINALAIQPDGKIVAAGVSFNGPNSDFASARYHTESSLATTFIDKENYALTVYPNPIDATSRLQFTLINEEIVSVYIYDAIGRKIKTLLDFEKIAAGNHEIFLDIADALASGNYFAVMVTSTSKATLKFVKQ